MPFAGPDLGDVPKVDLALLALCRHHAGAERDDQHLVAGGDVLSRGATLAGIQHCAVVSLVTHRA